jgi:hypothetical protein
MHRESEMDVSKRTGRYDDLANYYFERRAGVDTSRSSPLPIIMVAMCRTALSNRPTSGNSVNESSMHSQES